jgi:hypothetical protein
MAKNKKQAQKQEALRQDVLSDKRNAAKALAIQGFDWQTISNKTGVNNNRAQKLDAKLDRGSMLPGSMRQAQQSTPFAPWMDLNGNTGMTPMTRYELSLQRTQKGITKDFLRQYGSQDFLSQLKIRRDKVAANQQSIGQQPAPRTAPQPVSGAETSSLPPLFYQPSPGVYEPIDIEDESFFTGGSPQDSTRRGGVKRNKSNRAGAVSKTRNSLSIGGGATAPGTAIGGRQLSL